MVVYGVDVGRSCKPNKTRNRQFGGSVVVRAPGAMKYGEYFHVDSAP
jgi:hypothetical protein